MIELTAVYKGYIDDCGTPVCDMWVEDAPHIRAVGVSTISDAAEVLDFLIKEELASVWRVTGEYRIVSSKCVSDV
tara:strand:+ start:144 stop:368 length:225 start_codon:yes stop_codon:yes gene_type:complete